MARSLVTRRTFHYSPSMTFTGTVGTVCMFPLRAIIRISVALGISPNTLTLVGVLINCVAGWALAREHFVLAGFIMICANIVDFIDGKVAFITGRLEGRVLAGVFLARRADDDPL